MKKFLLGAIVALALAVAAIGAAIYAGVIDMAADNAHSRPVYRAIELARERFIARETRNLVPPADLASPDLASPERVRRGAGNYDAMCAGCHLAPDQRHSEIRAGLYPQPRDLTETVAGDTPVRQFWIIQHGIKATGMAAWSRGGMEDDAIWDVVALLQQLPKLDAECYRRLVEASEGHSHGGMASHADGEAGHHHHGDHDHEHEHAEHRH